jgi:hypothetical protein
LTWGQKRSSLRVNEGIESSLQMPLKKYYEILYLTLTWSQSWTELRKA